MIPNNIKIDDNGDFRIIDTVNYNKPLFLFTFEEIEDAYLFAKSKRDNNNKHIKYGCQAQPDKPYQCIIDYISTGLCINENCQYWRVFEVKK